MKIKISHLTPGVHAFQSQMTREVLGLEKPSIFREPINVKVNLQKFQQNLVVDITLKTVAHFSCDRCLTEFSKELNAKDRITFTMDETLLHDTRDDIRELGPNDVELDLTSDIREILLLAIPVKVVCREDCVGICANCGANLNFEKCNCQKTSVDPRWDALKKLTN